MLAEKALARRGGFDLPEVSGSHAETTLRFGPVVGGPGACDRIDDATVFDDVVSIGDGRGKVEIPLDRQDLSLRRYCFPRIPHLIGGYNGNGRGTGKVADRIETALAAIKFGPDGLVPAVAQQFDTGEILMVAWMSREAVRACLAESRACYWSRSRRKLWRKGETSGQVQLLREMRLDCDGDALLLLVDQRGVACHTGRRSCFFRAWRDSGWTIIAEPQVDPATLYPRDAFEGV